MGKWCKSKTKHCDLHISFEIKDEHPTTLWFKDQMHYGTVSIVDYKGLEKKLKSLGWDCLKPETHERGLSFEKWTKLCEKKSSWTFPKLLMCQTCISGVGNYLKAEILYEARVSPHKKIGECTNEEKKRVYDCTIKIPKLALENGFKLKVYGKKKDAKGFVVKRDKTLDNRTTHWVSEICT
jgi:formamidopyrimidine-DNA glycosylase